METIRISVILASVREAASDTPDDGSPCCLRARAVGDGGEPGGAYQGYDDGSLARLPEGVGWKVDIDHEQGAGKDRKLVDR